MGLAREKLTDFDMKRHKAREQKAWQNKLPWQEIYDDAYAYAIPYRKSASLVPGQSRVDNLFDDTAITSTFHGAGALKEDLFPSGQRWAELAPGPVSRRLAKQQSKENATQFARELELITEQVEPFFQTGEFDQAVTEYCIDLYAGTAVLLPVAGDSDNPVRFVAIPTNQVAIEIGAYGETTGVFWKKKMSRRALREEFPKGRFPKDFLDEEEKNGESEIEVRQDFVKRLGRGATARSWKWSLVVHIDKSEEPVVSETYRTQPIVVSRYHRVPGEAYGRGPILNALPAIKTLNKAQELVLKAVAIRMLGIWGYRPGGAFNPDTARLAPGQFWPMSSTGGVMGPDVFRLDQSTGDVQLGNLISQGLRERIQVALHDERLPERGATPISASEVAARMAKVRNNYIGAFGRMVHETIPVLYPRVMEILYDGGYLQTDLRPDQLFVNVRVISPLAVALRAQRLEPFIQFLQLAQALGRDPNDWVDIDGKLDQIVADMNIEPEYRRTKAERQKNRDDAKAAAEGAAVTEALTRKPELVANALGMNGGLQPPPASAP